LAATGTVTGQFNGNRQWAVTLSGITHDSTSQIFNGKAMPFANGTFGAGAMLQFQGSNDGAMWVNIGSVISTDPWAGTLTPGGMSFAFYQLVVTGGDGTTSINVSIVFSPQT
jgi:hypothetical protein